MKFTVDIKTWRRGGIQFNELYGHTVLLNEEGYRCCLGFVCQQLGASNEMICGFGTPYKVRGILDIDKDNILVQPHSGDNTKLTQEAMSINDSPNISDNERMRQLQELFAKHGHELEFV